MEKGVIAKEAILLDSNGQRWIVGSFIGIKGIAENYEAASYNEIRTDYSAILQIVPSGDKPLPDGFQFYLDHAKPNDLDNWKGIKQVKHLGIPVLLGAGSLKINEQNYTFMVIERYGKDLWSLFLERNRKFEAHTVYKISLQIINALKYIHSKSYFHEDIKASNISLHITTKNHIYLMNDQLVVHTVTNDQADPDKICNAVVLMSRDAHKGVSTMRGDMEMLFYNLVQWLGIELPWEKNFKDPSMVLKEKTDAFADVEIFLENWSKETAIPPVVCEYMKRLATLDTKVKPVHSDFIDILIKGLRILHHVPFGNLEFSISNVPPVEPIAEDINQVNKAQRRRKHVTTIPKLGNSVTLLANIISENCRHENEVRLRDVGPGSLIEIICWLTCKKKNNSEWQNRLANAWERDTADLKTMTKKLWREKELRAKGITSEVALIKQNRPDVPNQDSTVTTAASTQENTIGLVHSNPGSSNSQSRCEGVSPVGMPPNEHTASPDLSNTSPPNARQTAPSPPTSRWSEVQSSPIRPISGYSSRSSVQDDSHFENTSFSRTSEQFSDTEHCRVPEVSVLRVNREAGRTDEEVTECWMSESVGCESWKDDYEMLNTCLKMKEPYLDAFRSIPSEPQQVADRVQQVRVHLDDLRTRNPRRHRLEQVLAKLPRNSADVQKLEEIGHRWWILLDWLEKHGQELGEASLDQSLNALQEVSKNLDKLLLDNDPEEQQLKKIEIFSEQIEDLQRTLLADATTLVEQLSQAISRQAYTYGFRVKLRSVETFYSDLQQKIRIKRAEVESSLSDRRQYDDLCKNAHDWLLKELANIMEKPLVSTDRLTLQQQIYNYKVENQRVMDKETVVMELLETGRSRSRPHNILDSIESQWNRLLEQSLDIVKNLETCAEICDKFHQLQDLHLRWLSEVERKLESVKPASLDDIGKQLKELNALRDEVREKSGEFEQYDNLGHKFIDICDVDKDDVMKNELSATKDRWIKLNNDLLTCLQSFEDTDKRFADFNKSLLDLKQNIDLYENESAAHDALQAAAKDSKLLQRLRELGMIMTSLQVPIDFVRQQADSLVLKAREQGIDASHLLNVVNNTAIRIDNLKTKFDDTRNEILELEHARFVKDTRGDKSVESRDYCKTNSESRKDRDSVSNSPRRSKKKSESPSTKRSQSKDSVSSPSKSSKNSDGSKSHNNKYDDYRPNSNLNPSEPKRSTHSKDSHDSNRDFRSPRYDMPAQDRSYYRNDRPYNYSDRSFPSYSNQKPYWQRRNFRNKPNFRQDYRSNTFPNCERRNEAQSVSSYDSRFGRGNWWKSHDSRNNQRRGFHQNQPFRNFSRENNTYGQVTSARDRTCDREPNAVGVRKRQKEQEEMNVNHAKSGKGLRKGKVTENQLERDPQKLNKPLVNYTCSDEDSDHECAMKIKEEIKESP